MGNAAEVDGSEGVARQRRERDKNHCEAAGICGCDAPAHPAIPQDCPYTACQMEFLERISHAKHEWESTVDVLPEIILLLDGDGRVVRANRAVEGWGLGRVLDIKGCVIHEILHPDCHDADCYFAEFWEDSWTALAQGRPAACEAEDRLLRRHIRCEVRPHGAGRGVGQAGSASFAVAILHDVSELKRAERMLKRFNEELEARVQARTLERMKAEQSLRESESELRLLSAQLITAQEQERKRIASELHDGMGQTLSAVKFCVEDALRHLPERSGNHGAQLLEKVIPMIKGAIEEVRRISMDLRPSMLDDLGILATLAWFLRQFESVYGDIRVIKQISIQEQDVPAPLKTTIYRIVQEAMNNVAKHGNAVTVYVSLSRTDGMIELSIRDDGQGFEPGRPAGRGNARRGFGLAGMRERVEFSGGHFNITSAKGHGTLVRTAWPCCNPPPC